MSTWIKKVAKRYASRARNGVGLLGLIVLALQPAAAQPSNPRFYCDTHGNVLPYRVYVPPNYSAAKKYPLILFLHDASKNGYDNSRQLENTAPLALITPANVAKYPTFFVAPQCPVGENWNTPSVQQLVMAMLAQVEAEFSIDVDRLYLTGGSMGGFGTWSMIQNYPDTFAAAFPMSGAPEDPSNPPQDIPPLWVFHSADDNTVPVAGDRTGVFNLRNDGLPIIYTEYVSGDHYVYWPTAYALPALLDWIMAQRLGQPSTAPPLVTRLVPPDTTPITTNATTLSLSGTAADAYTSVTSVTWTNTTGASGIATGTNTWSVDSVPLSPGTNVINVIAGGANWGSGYGGMTTFNNPLIVNCLPTPAEPSAPLKR